MNPGRNCLVLKMNPGRNCYVFKVRIRQRDATRKHRSYPRAGISNIASLRKALGHLGGVEETEEERKRKT